MYIFKRCKTAPNYHYARIDENKCCISVWRFSCPIDRPDTVEICSLDYALIGNKRHDGLWSENHETGHDSSAGFEFEEGPFRAA
jgi:hypothetical protein